MLLVCVIVFIFSLFRCRLIRRLISHNDFYSSSTFKKAMISLFNYTCGGKKKKKRAMESCLAWKFSVWRENRKRFDGGQGETKRVKPLSSSTSIYLISDLYFHTHVYINRRPYISVTHPSFNTPVYLI